MLGAWYARRGRCGVTSANLAIGIVCCAESEMQHSLAPEAEGESETSHGAPPSLRSENPESPVPCADAARVTYESFPPPLCPGPPRGKDSPAGLAWARKRELSRSPIRCLVRAPRGYLVRSVRMATPPARAIRLGGWIAARGARAESKPPPASQNRPPLFGSPRPGKTHRRARHGPPDG
jgi:hypothetical protein